MKDFLYKFLKVLKQVTKYVCYIVLLFLILLAVYTFVVTELYDEDKNPVEVARHPDNIYYIKVDIDFLIPEYSMMRIVQRKGESYESVRSS